MSLWTQRALPGGRRAGAGRSGDSGHTPAAGIKGTPRRGRDFRRYPLRQDGRWLGVGRRKEEEEGGNSHLPAAVPAGWEAVGGRQDRESVRSTPPAVCNTQPRQRCSLAGSRGALQDPLRWPLALWVWRTEANKYGESHLPHAAMALASAHLASCSTPPRLSCSPAVGVHRAAEAAGLREQGRWSGLPHGWASAPSVHCRLTNFFVILFPGLGVV